MSIFGKMFGQGTSASLQSVKFDASRYSDQGERTGSRVWFMPEGGGVALYFFPSPPGLPVNITAVKELQDFYATQMGANQRIVECRLQILDGLRSIWLIAVGPAPAAQGSVYLGSLTIPFQDFSFVIKVQCQEQGATGMREAVVMDLALRDGSAFIQNAKPVLQGFTLEDERYDGVVPQHPLSRVRRELRQIAASIVIDARVRKEKPFAFPDVII